MADNFNFTPGTGATGAAKEVGGVLYPEVIEVETDGTPTGLSAKLGSLTEAAPASDTASSGLNGRLQRIAQRLTTLIGSTIAVSGTFWQATQPVSEADGANVTLGAKADAKSTATDTTAITIMSVLKQISASVQAAASSLSGTLTVASHAVTNAGTFAVQAAATLAAETTKVIGTVRLLGNAGAIVDGVNTAATAPANGVLGLGIYNSTEPSPTTGQSVGIQLDSKGRQRIVLMDAAGNTRGANVDSSNRISVSVDGYGTAGTPPAGNGTTSVTTPRVTLASDSTGQVSVTTVGTITPGTAATSLGKAEDAAHADGDVGIMSLAVRKNTAASTSGTDGDYQPLITNTTGHLWVDASGQTLTVGSHAVTNAGTFAVQATIAASATNIAKAEDVASADADVGVPAMAIQKATPTDTAGTDGDYAMLQMSAGRLWSTANIDKVAGTAIDTNSGNKSAGTLRVVLATDQPALTNKLLVTPDANAQIDLNKIAGTTIVNGGVAGSQSIGGTVATNVAITANPINLGAQAVSSENSAVTTARQVQLVADLVGKLIVLPYANPENFVSGAITSAMTGTTSTSLVAAPAAGLRNYITTIVVSNAHATVGTDIIIQDGSGGTTLMTIPAAAVYGGAVINLPVPLRQPTTATAIYCANVTTGASTKVSAVGYKGV